MPRNLELKAKIVSPGRIIRILRAHADFLGEIRQTDTYFAVRKGRLKLREVAGEASELIYYERNEGRGPRWSDYETTAIPSGLRIKRALLHSLGILAVVKKRRLAYYYKKVGRVHVDAVGGLGHFVELEVESAGDPKKAEKIRRELIALLMIENRREIRRSYLDLVQEKRKRSPAAGL
ncbi:MAG TPA: class IV adenylate cyclase [Bacteroidota bacterium]|nr:class IV adenylate cyclase [Bacteroidota bacterium]